MLADNRNNDEIFILYEIFQKNTLFEKLSLTEREKLILEMRWKYGYTYELMSKQLNLSPQRVRQIYERIIEKIDKSFCYLFKNEYDIEGIREKVNSVLIIEISDFPIKLKAELNRLKIFTIVDLSKASRRTLMSYSRIGKKSILLMEQVLANYNLVLVE